MRRQDSTTTPGFTRIGALGRILAAGTAVSASVARIANAEVFTSQGLTFVAVRDAGNRAATVAEAPLWPTFAPPLGAVDHEFGIMRTNVTNADWVEFVRAYAPYYSGGLGELDLTGRGIVYNGSPGGVPQYSVAAGHERRSTDVTWRIAARYANWLHNNKSSSPAAFENGAYDTTTFGEQVVGGFTVLTDQVTHHPDARFWIPSAQEYTKAAHWDPNRYGPGEGGYWLMPNGGDDRLVAGPPGVGEAGGDWWQTEWGFIDVELYPDTQSPWGMLDVSSTNPQHTEGWIHPLTGTMRQAAGSSAGSSGYWNNDRLDNFYMILPHSNYSVRIATAIPGSATVAVLGLAGVVATHRWRTKWNATRPSSCSL